MTSPSAAPPDFAHVVVERVLEGLGGEPLFPEAANEALRLARQPDCTVAAFTEVVHWDPCLAARVLSIANSCLYSPRRPIESLERAVALLGFQECQNIIVATCVSRLMQHHALKDEQARTQLCHHSYTTSLIARFVSQDLRLGFQGEDFTAGLLHDIGRILLLIDNPVGFRESETYRFDEETSARQREQAVMGVDHCGIGGMLCETLGLPSRLADAVRHHHAPEHAEHDERLVRLVAASDHAANFLQLGHAPEDYCLTDNPWLFSIDAALSEETWERLQGGFTGALLRVSEEAEQMTALFGS